MICAVILYGSRARGDDHLDSDADLIGVSTADDIAKTFDSLGTSFHAYPRAWLLSQAAEGSLFVMHVCFEGRAIYDPDGYFDILRSSFCYKRSYLLDVEVGARVISAVINMDERYFNGRMRRRYFWGLRTALMASMAELHLPTFSSKALEASFGIDGLSGHIRDRNCVSFSECIDFGARAIRAIGADLGQLSDVTPKDNLNALFDFSGVAGATAGEIIYGFS